MAASLFGLTSIEYTSIVLAQLKVMSDANAAKQASATVVQAGMQ